MSGANSQLISSGAILVGEGFNNNSFITINAGGTVSAAAEVGLGQNMGSGTVTVGGTGAASGGTLVADGLMVGEKRSRWAVSVP